MEFMKSPAEDLDSSLDLDTSKRKTVNRADRSIFPAANLGTPQARPVSTMQDANAGNGDSIAYDDLPDEPSWLKPHLISSTNNHTENSSNPFSNPASAAMTTQVMNQNQSQNQIQNQSTDSNTYLRQQQQQQEQSGLSQGNSSTSIPLVANGRDLDMFQKSQTASNRTDNNVYNAAPASASGNVDMSGLRTLSLDLQQQQLQQQQLEEQLQNQPGNADIINSFNSSHLKQKSKRSKKSKKKKKDKNPSTMTLPQNDSEFPQGDDLEQQALDDAQQEFYFLQQQQANQSGQTQPLQYYDSRGRVLRAGVRTIKIFNRLCCSTRRRRIVFGFFTVFSWAFFIGFGVKEEQIHHRKHAGGNHETTTAAIDLGDANVTNTTTLAIDTNVTSTISIQDSILTDEDNEEESKQLNQEDDPSDVNEQDTTLDSSDVTEDPITRIVVPEAPSSITVMCAVKSIELPSGYTECWEACLPSKCCRSPVPLTNCLRDNEEICVEYASCLSLTLYPELGKNLEQMNTVAAPVVYSGGISSEDNNSVPTNAPTAGSIQQSVEEEPKGISIPEDIPLAPLPTATPTKQPSDAPVTNRPSFSSVILPTAPASKTVFDVCKQGTQTDLIQCAYVCGNMSCCANRNRKGEAPPCEELGNNEHYCDGYDVCYQFFQDNNNANTYELEAIEDANISAYKIPTVENDCRNVSNESVTAEENSRCYIACDPFVCCFQGGSLNCAGSESKQCFQHGVCQPMSLLVRSEAILPPESLEQICDDVKSDQCEAACRPAECCIDWAYGLHDPFCSAKFCLKFGACESFWEYVEQQETKEKQNGN